MQRGHLRHMLDSSSNDVLDLLTVHQYLRPHQPLRDVLQRAMEELGCCPVAIQRAVAWLEMDASGAIGRLRRCELVQLSNSISRFWRQAVSGTVSESFR